VRHGRCQDLVANYDCFRNDKVVKECRTDRICVMKPRHETRAWEKRYECLLSAIFVYSHSYIPIYLSNVYLPVWPRIFLFIQLFLIQMPYMAPMILMSRRRYAMLWYINSFSSFLAVVIVIIIPCFTLERLLCSSWLSISLILIPQTHKFVFQKKDGSSRPSETGCIGIKHHRFGE